MKLTDLEPQFVRYERRYVDGVWGDYLPHANSISEAQGVLFLCPSCFVRNGGAVGTHLIEVSFAGPGVQDHQGSRNRKGAPSRWDVTGTAYTVSHSVSPDQSPDCAPAEPACAGWHGYVTNGDAA